MPETAGGVSGAGNPAQGGTPVSSKKEVGFFSSIGKKIKNLTGSTDDKGTKISQTAKAAQPKVVTAAESQQALANLMAMAEDITLTPQEALRRMKPEAEVEGKKINIRTELHEALETDDSAAIHKMIDQLGVSELLKVLVDGGRNLLHLACIQGKDKIIEAILSKATAADIDALTVRDTSGRTALHHVFYCSGMLPDVAKVTPILKSFEEFCAESGDPSFHAKIFQAKDKENHTPFSILSTKTYTSQESENLQEIQGLISQFKKSNPWLK